MAKPALTSIGFDLFRRLVVRQGVPVRDAEDVAQEALLRGLEADQRIEQGGDSAPYRVTIALNQARNHVRDAGRRGEVLTSFDERDLHGGGPTPEDLLRLRQRAELMRRLIAQVDLKYRDILIRHELEETPLVEIAAELGLNIRTVQTQYRRAREELNAQMRRWQAHQDSRGWGKDACVAAPLAFGFRERASWVATLRRFGVRLLVQGTFVAVAGALVSGAAPVPGLTSWLRPAAVRAVEPAPTAEDVVAPALPADGAAIAAHAASSPVGDSNAGVGVVVSSTAAPAVTTAPRPASPAGAVRPAVPQRERSLVNKARRAIEAHTALSYLEARSLLEAHAREFPRGPFAAEREALLRQIR
ncbi:RNA polymerase sigma factor [Sorangium cellulosum]|uniref:RNA polymerase subunit sigma n=1 Tax=Sorangium cellulosum TaxID=56 RepID=A0A150QP48_SORCE|nr:RNA polymerase sigma factor [Sorangium cellulosum]KYF69761.1 RNA polymerase subunit sigma [Sorangium cellulosum]